MLRKKKREGAIKRKIPIEHTGFYSYLQRYLESRLVLGYSEETNKRYDSNLRRFIAWCDERDIDCPQDVTRQVLEAYQRHLHYLRKPDGEPMSLASQNVYLSALCVFFKWLAKSYHIVYNPASEITLPKRAKTLPRALLSQDDVSNIMNQPDINTPDGLRDRAILELFYSCGVRRKELSAIKCQDLDLKRQVLLVKVGKGNKERCLPVGDCATQWLKKYVEEVRDQLLDDVGETAFFLMDYGEAFNHNRLGERVKKYMQMAGIEVQGSCHLLRHAMATHMLENGADIRFIQMMLGHEDLNSTEIYTRVSIEKLREVHSATHPAKMKAENSDES